MKNLLILILFCLSVTSCKKSPVEPGSPDKEYLPSLTGNWRWVETTGGLAGVHIKPTEGGESKFFSFSSNHKYQFLDNNNLWLGNYSEGGSFTLTNDSINIFHIKTVSINFSITDTNNVPVSNYYKYNLVIESLKDDTLKLFEDVADGFNYVYVKDVTFIRH